MNFITWLKKLRNSHKATPSFNVYNLETVQAVAEAARQSKKPVIVQVSEKALQYAGFETLVTMIVSVWQTTKLPLFLHLDHGKDLVVIKKCINSGFFTSVHIDASDKPLAQNIKLTKMVVGWAHPKKVAVQGELGTILGKEGYQKLQKLADLAKAFTHLDQIKEYVSQTKLDYLAVSIGNVHGNVTSSRGLDYVLLKKIAGRTSLPLVLHGGSGVKDSDLKKVKKFGMAVVNIDSDLRQAFLAGVFNAVKIKGVSDPRQLLSVARGLMTKTALTKIKLLS